MFLSCYCCDRGSDDNHLSLSSLLAPAQRTAQSQAVSPSLCVSEKLGSESNKHGLEQSLSGHKVDSIFGDFTYVQLQNKQLQP